QPSDNVQASKEAKIEAEKVQEKINKKPTSERKKAPRVLRRLKIKEDEETNEEPLVNKRMRTKPKQAQPASDDMDTEADT
ncbi:hypothetical protein A2U01_0058186, partial [Trifolium medium]|nr:hypothetical protein [Trifolium medium]